VLCFALLSPLYSSTSGTQRSIDGRRSTNFFIKKNNLSLLFLFFFIKKEIKKVKKKKDSSLFFTGLTLVSPAAKSKLTILASPSFFLGQK
jgi:hypothetical protein